jgi:hypothetical protein
MKDWRALPSKGGLIGSIFTGLAAILFGLAVWVTWQAATATELVEAVQSEDANPDIPPELLTIPSGNNLGTFGLALLCVALLLVVIYLAYQTRKFFALRYSLDRNAIQVHLGDSRQVIPLANVRYMLPAEVVLARAKEKGTNAADMGQARSTAASANKAYSPKAVPPASTELEPEMVEVDADQLDTNGRSYQLTRTAAADSDLEHLENIEIETAEFVEISDGETPSNAVRAEGSDVMTGRDLSSREYRTLAIDFEEPGTEGAGTGPDTSAESSAGKSIPDQNETTTTATEIETGKGSRRPFNSWPGFYLNRSRVPALGLIQFYSTRELEGTLLIRTDRQTYAISPRDRQQFITEFNLRKRLGAIEPVQEGIVNGTLLSHPLWHDKLGRGLILAGILLNMALYFFLLLKYNNFPEILRIHFNKVGQVDRLGDRGELMLMPFIGLVTVVTNSFVGAFLQVKESIPAYLLYAAGVLLQFLVGIALIVILIVS